MGGGAEFGRGGARFNDLEELNRSQQRFDDEQFHKMNADGASFGNNQENLFAKPPVEEVRKSAQLQSYDD